jgi:hypothetical protein
LGIAPQIRGLVIVFFLGSRPLRRFLPAGGIGPRIGGVIIIVSRLVRIVGVRPWALAIVILIERRPARWLTAATGVGPRVGAIVVFVKGRLATRRRAPTIGIRPRIRGVVIVGVRRRRSVGKIAPQMRNDIREVAIELPRWPPVRRLVRLRSLFASNALKHQTLCVSRAVGIVSSRPLEADAATAYHIAASEREAYTAG